MASVIERLYRRYGMNSDRKGDEMLSSHWKHYVASILVNAHSIESADVSGITGTGFGSYRFQNHRQALFDRIAVFGIERRLPERSAIRGLRSRMRPFMRQVGMDLTLDVFRQCCSAQLIAAHSHLLGSERPLFMIIGDGYGVLSVLLKRLFPEAAFLLVDIGPVLLIQSVFCKHAFPHHRHRLAEDLVGIDLPDFIFCPAEHLIWIEGLRVDMAVNIASMQEMDPAVIGMYFDWLRHHLKPKNLFYCCNRMKKTLLGGEVTEFLNYPWADGDRHLVDEPCPWHQYFMAGSPVMGTLRWRGLPLPFVQRYDGEHRHRLSIMHTQLHEEFNE